MKAPIYVDVFDVFEKTKENYPRSSKYVEAQANALDEVS
jgi:hypothetical protein